MSNKPSNKSYFRNNFTIPVTIEDNYNLYLLNPPLIN